MRKILKLLTISLSSTFLYACSQPVQDGPPKRQVNVANVHNAVPKKLAYSRYGNPDTYTVNGVTYHTLKTNKGYDKEGVASWYGTKFNGQHTSSGEPYDMFAMTAANKVLPIPCFVRVVDLENHRSIIVKVNDRGPFEKNRLIDLSYVAALKLGMLKTGTAKVEVIAIDTNKNTHQQGLGNLYIQAGAFTDKSHARALSSKIKKASGLDSTLETAKVDGKAYTRVYVGPIQTIAKAESVQDQLKALGVAHPLGTVQKKHS